MVVFFGGLYTPATRTLPLHTTISTGGMPHAGLLQGYAFAPPSVRGPGSAVAVAAVSTVV